MAGKFAHRLRHIITLQKPVPKPGRISGNEVIWEDHLKDIHAAVEPYRGREYFYSQQVQSESTLRVRLRWYPDITPDMRIMYAGRVLNIVSVIDPEEAHRELQLMCKEGVNDG